MQAQWVTVQFVNGPRKVGSRYGSIKVDDGSYISVPVEQLTQFRKGGRYCIEIEQNGNYLNFVRFANQPPGQAAQRPAGGYPQAQRMQPRPQQQPQQQPQVLRGPRVRLPVPEPVLPTEDQRMMFITGVVGRAMGSGKFASFEIKGLTESALKAWNQVLLGQPVEEATLDQTFDDPVPDPAMYGQVNPLEEDEIQY